MTFCTAHRPAPQPAQQAIVPLPRGERRAYRAKPVQTAPGQLFTDWASL